MTADIVYSIEINELVKFLEKRENINFNDSKEYIVLKPKTVDDYFELRVLYSDESHPKEWVGYEKIKSDWEKES